MARIYTGAGDEGYTWCPRGGGRVAKTHPCIEFVGALDEAEAAVGLARSLLAASDSDIAILLRDVEELLFRVGFAFSTGKPCIGEEDLQALEETIDYVSGQVEPAFMLNGGTAAAAAVGLARAVARRAERRLWGCLEALEERSSLDMLAAKILNRVSDLLYALQVLLAKRAGAGGERPSCSTRLAPRRLGAEPQDAARAKTGREAEAQQTGHSKPHPRQPR